MPKYLLYMAQLNTNFRLAEMESLADFYGLTIDFSNHKEESPYFLVDLPDDESAQKWVLRMMLSRGIYEFWGSGKTNEELHESVKINSSEKWETYRASSFKFDFLGYQGSRTQKEQVSLIEEFSYLPLDGPVRMKKPDEVFTILEEFEGDKSVYKYFGRLVGYTARELGVLDSFDLRKRRYVGTTSFEAELSLVSVNIGQVGPGKIAYDPFVGTGSFLVTAAKFGAVTIGSDIDAKPLIGKKNHNIRSNFKQYGLELGFLDVCTMDFTHNALRKSLIIDTIVCDPPYGVREGLKVLGTARPEHFKGKENIIIDGQKAHLRKEYIPTKKPFSLGKMLDELLDFAAERLPVGGRLVFWMPVANDEDYTTAVPLNGRLELKYNCVQKFNKWSRRLLCYIKREEEWTGQENRVEGEVSEFRQRYFSGFKKQEPSS